jgi:hypothetical protein
MPVCELLSSRSEIQDVSFWVGLCVFVRLLT